MTSISLAHLAAQGIVLEGHEAVAIVLQLIDSASAAGADAAASPPYGPPSVDRLELHADGTVTCSACATTPTPSEMAILLQGLVPDGHVRLPGGVRYAVARALHDVDAPPFDSIEAFARALERYVRGDRRRLVRQVMARGAAASSTTALVRVSAAPVAVVVTYRPRRRPLRIPAVAAGLAAGLSLMAVGETMHLLHALSFSPPIVASAPPSTDWLQSPPLPAVQMAVEPSPAPERSPLATDARRAVRLPVAKPARSRPHRRARHGSRSQVLSWIRFDWVRHLFSRRTDL